MACFHAQQAVEKCLKAVLFARLVEFRRTHDLIELADLLERNGVKVPVTSQWFKSLNPFAVAFRYEEAEPGRIDTGALSDVVRKVRAWAGEMVG
jgi:HEPN domain-containing protein